MINPQDSCSEHSSPILAKNVTEFPDISAKYKASSFNIYVKAKGGNYLIFNTMTGALAHIAGDKYTHLAGLLKNPNSFGRENEEEKLFLKSALKAGFIIDDKTNELEMLKMISFAGRFTSEHFHLTIMPTLQCNFACTYCYEKPRPGIMRPEVRQALIKWAEMKVKTSNLFSVAWFGGEPLLAHGCIRELSSNFIGLCARENVKYRAGITTNGYLMNKDIVDSFSELAIESVQVTLDGPPDVHNRMRILKNGGATYDRIIKNLYYLCKTQPKIKVHLRVNYNSETINNIPKFLSELPNEVRQNAYIYIAEIYHCSAFLGESGEASGSTVAARINDRLPLTKREKLGITMLCLKCKSPGEAHSGLINFPMKPRPAYCEADYSNNFVVDPLGDLFKCTVSFQQELKVGQIRKDGKAIFNLPNLSIWLSKDPFSQRKCRNCRVLPICMGGCRSSSAKMSNSRCSAPLTHKDLVVALQLLYENGLLNGQCAQ